jgi:hypothetical protein
MTFSAEVKTCKGHAVHRGNFFSLTMYMGIKRSSILRRFQNYKQIFDLFILQDPKNHDLRARPKIYCFDFSTLLDGLAPILTILL